MKKPLFCLLPILILIAGSAFGEGFKYNIKVAHEGCNITPSQAYEMVKKDPDHTFVVDVRTRPEYQLIGHPIGAYNIPRKFWTGTLGEKNYGMIDNLNFEKDLLAQFNPAKDKLIFMCRSGKRSCLANIAAMNAGWSPQDVCNMLGGFEGDKIKNKNSVYNNQRKFGGWKNEGLPATYDIDRKLAYKFDRI